MYSNIIRGLDFSVMMYQNVKQNQKGMRFIHQIVSKNIPETGLEVVPSFYNTKHQLLLCPGHKNAYIRNQGISDVPLTGFESECLTKMLFLSDCCHLHFGHKFMYMYAETFRYFYSGAYCNM